MLQNSLPCFSFSEWFITYFGMLENNVWPNLATSGIRNKRSIFSCIDSCLCRDWSGIANCRISQTYSKPFRSAYLPAKCNACHLLGFRKLIFWISLDNFFKIKLLFWLFLLQVIVMWANRTANGLVQGSSDGEALSRTAVLIWRRLEVLFRFAVEICSL